MEETMFINKGFKRLSKEDQIDQLKIWIDKLKDDDINRTILKNKLNSLNDESKSYVKKEYKDIYKVNH